MRYVKEDGIITNCNNRRVSVEPRPTAPHRTTTWRWTVAIASMTLAAAVAFFNRPGITNVSVGYPFGTKSPQPWVTLPFHADADAATDNFTVSATLEHSVFSSGVLRIKPDDCIESIRVNNQEIAAVNDAPKSSKCWPSTYQHDLSPHLQLGGNRLAIDITNANGGYGIYIIPIYSQHGLIAIAGLVWFGIYTASLALSVQSRAFRSFLANGPGRMALVAFLPSLGAVLLAATMANSTVAFWASDHAAPTLLAAILPSVALLTCLDRFGEGPLLLRPSLPLAALSLTSFAIASILLAGQWTDPTINAVVMTGAFTGFFASVPLRPFLKRAWKAPRAVAVAMVAALAPHAYWALNLPAWGLLSGVTAAMVRGILWLCGFPTSTFTREKVGEDGQIIDYHAYVSSSDFSVQIGSWCSGFEGVSLFVFLLSLFVLLDWPLFSKVRHLWAIYLLTVPFILVVNAVRIAALFLYAEWNVWQHGHSTAVWATIEAFHSNIGWVIYSIAFVVFLPLVYRWERRAAKAK